MRKQRARESLCHDAWRCDEWRKNAQRQVVQPRIGAGGELSCCHLQHDVDVKGNIWR